MLGFRPKVGVAMAMNMSWQVHMQLEQSLSIRVHFTHAELSKQVGHGS